MSLSLAPFPLLTSVKIFQQWGTRLCAHIRTTDNISAVPPKLELGDASSRIASDILKYMQSESAPVNPQSSSCDSGRTADTLLIEAGRQLAENPEWLTADADVVLSATPYLLFPWDEAQGEKPQEIFIGLCDLPEMLSLAYDLRFVGLIHFEIVLRSLRSTSIAMPQTIH
jgi:hypothetical protein